MREDMHEGTIPDEPQASAQPEPPFVPAADPFPAEATPSPFHELDSRPHFFDDHGYQVSVDRQFWWNGGAWVAGQPPGRGSANASPAVTKVQAAIALGGLLLFAGFAFSVCQSMPGSAFPTP